MHLNLKNILTIRIAKNLVFNKSFKLTPEIFPIYAKHHV